MLQEDSQVDKKSLKNELEYLWMYQKWPLLAILVAVMFIVSSMFAAFSKKETVLYAMLVDCHTEVNQDKMESDYLETMNLDPKNQQAQIQTGLLFSDSESGSYTMTSLSRFLADIGSEKLDVCGMLEEDFLKYDNSETWMDLRELLDADCLSAIADTLFTKNGRVIGIYTDALPKMQEYGCYENTNSRGVLGVIYNSPRLEAAKNYLLFVAGLT